MHSLSLSAARRTRTLATLTCVATLATGCLFVADPPTSIKRLEPAPEVVFVDPVADGMVNGETRVKVRLVSTLDVRGTLWIDGEEVEKGPGSPLVYAWDTFAAARGWHELRVEATDEVGRKAEATIQVNVDQLPVVEILSPSADEVVEGEVDVEVEVSDDSRVASITLQLDGEVLAEDQGSPWSLAFDTCEAPDGRYVLRVEATDDVGNVGYAERTVTAQRPIGVTIDRESSFAEAADELRAEVAWSEEVERVWFEVDGEEVASWTDLPGSICHEGCQCRIFAEDWDTRDLPEGTYQVEAFLQDSTGRTASDATTVQVRHDRDNDGHDAIGYGGDDCDDQDDDVHPGAAETCNDKDDDCNGQVDEGFDADGDGYAGHGSCPAGDWFDCDDGNAAVHPGATEICGDGVDNDCDGPDDTCLLTGTWTVAEVCAATWDGETSSDYVGYTLGTPGDVTGDGVDDLLMGSVWMDSTAGTTGFSGGLYLVSGAATSGTMSLSSATALLEGTGNQTGFGMAAVGIGDVDRDGYANFAVSEPYAGYGVVYLFDGPLVDDRSPADATTTLSWSGSSIFGASLAAGDLDNDGDQDLVVGTCKVTTSRNVGIYRGPLTLARTSPDVILADDHAGGAGCAVAVVRDTDGDGRDDILIGAPADGTSGESAGAAWLLTDLPSATGDLSDHDEAFITGRVANEVGWEVSSAGDTDGDGYGDFLVSTPIYDSGGDGRAWLFLGPVSGTVSVTSADALFTADSGDAAGQAATSLDFDGDGLTDVALSMPNNASGSHAGAVALLYGPVPTGSVDLLDDADLLVEGASAGGWLGSDITNAGDLDEDGADDLLMGAAGFSTSDAGRVYLLFGQGGY